MNFFHLVEGVFLKLSVIPGLGFLHEYVHELETSNTRRKQEVEKYRGYARAVRETGDEVRHGGHHGHEEHGEHQEHGGHGKKGKRTGRSGPPARGGHAAKPPHEKEELEDLEKDYEDDDFESYLQ